MGKIGMTCYWCSEQCIEDESKAYKAAEAGGIIVLDCSTHPGKATVFSMFLDPDGRLRYIARGN